MWVIVCDEGAKKESSASLAVCMSEREGKERLFSLPLLKLNATVSATDLTHTQKFTLINKLRVSIYLVGVCVCVCV